ncbi:hypothetical protein H1R20_g1726, partial [Candolleomyces eurysporus]
MDPPKRPRRRDEAKEFLRSPVNFVKERFGSRTSSPSRSRPTSPLNVAGDKCTSSKASPDVPTANPLIDDTNRGEIQTHQDNIGKEAISSLPAQKDPAENMFIPSASTFDHDGASQVSDPPLMSGRLSASQEEGESQGATAHVENLKQDHGTAVLEGYPLDLSRPAQSNIPAIAISHAEHEPQEITAHIEHQPAGLASKIYEGVKTTLRRVVDVSDVFPPLKSAAAGLLVICDTIDAYGENKQEFNELIKRMEVLSRIMDSCPSDVSQEVKDRFDGLARTLEEKQKILKDKVDPTRSGFERVMLTAQDKQLVLKLTQEIRFAIEIAMFDAIIENRAQTLQIVRGVNWLKQRIDEMELQDQYLKLILQPAEKTFAGDELLVLGVDALDECEDQDAVRLFIAAIASQKPNIPLRFFLTSRPEVSLRESFDSSTHHGWLRLHDIEADIVRADILLYLNDRFKCIPRVYNHYQANWPPPEIQTIVNLSGTLFIIAATMAGYISTSSGNGLERFQELAKPSANVQLSGIDALYSRILTEAFKDLEQKEADMICSCLSLLVTAQKPISVSTYAKLHGKEASAIREAFKSLHSVVQMPDEGCDDTAISIFHASFVDYLTSEKVHGKQWAIDKCTAHCLTAKACFTLMNSGLYFGVSGAETSYRGNDDQPTPLHIESALAYACTAWGDHVLYAGVTKPLQEKMQEFVETTKILYWLEALSVLKNVRYGYNTLWQISKELMSTELGGLLNKIGDFVHNFATPIGHSVPHLYLSALPFYAAAEQPVQELLKLGSVPIIHHNLTQKQVVSVIQSEQGVATAAFSPNGKYIVLGLEGGTVELWSAQTGQPALEPMTGHSGWVTSVAFSPDGKLWDARTAQPALEPIKGHTHLVTSVAFSPDGKYIVSGPHNKAIHLWNICHGQLAYKDLLFLHDYPITSLALNNDGWIQNPSGNLLLWIPPHFRDGLFLPGARHIIGNLQVTKVELTNAVYHGADWSHGN